MPKRIRTSPTKLGEPGIASVAKPMIRNTAASIGVRNAIPPIRESDSLPSFVRCERTATIMNSAPATSPWVTICITAP